MCACVHVQVYVCKGVSVVIVEGGGRVECWEDRVTWRQVKLSAFAPTPPEHPQIPGGDRRGGMKKLRDEGVTGCRM